ncbi:MAG: protein-L-isoaspartate(D-aspartate) O-methyltransferase [Actinobacteria bacterium]|nr:protein-L-isoaspartate(D-aspartate) O-methyltransferase [Actinomycetota bacterium]
MSRRGRRSLVERAAALGVTDQRVLDALRDTPRVAFVPPAARLVADRDAPIPIGHGQTTSQPSLIAHIVAALGLRPTDRVLEVGTGLGYQTALLAQVAGTVYSIDRFADLVATAGGNLAAQHIRNVELTVGDGTEGWPEHAPFDAIVVSAAFHEVPPPLVDQLADGGRLVQPLGGDRGDDLLLFRKESGELVVDRHLGAARFVPLRGHHGLTDDG